MYRYNDKEFIKKRDEYIQLNRNFEKKLVFHVGTEAGFYSELGSMFEAMAYAYVHRIRFVLYADDANFSGEKGWNDFFVSFCDETHLFLHHYLNRRNPIRRYPKLGKICQSILKKIFRIDYLTSDIFQQAISAEFKKEYIDYPLFSMKGSVYPEIAKMYSLGMHFNAETWEKIQKVIGSLGLPKHYMSMQIRGGDKSTEYAKLYDAKECMEKIRKMQYDITELFVFTDDYRNISYLREKCPDIRVYTLTRPEERGYVNADFYKMPWEKRKEELIKLFAMVEICCNSDIHFGCEQACVNNIIKAVKQIENPQSYVTLVEKGVCIKKPRQRKINNENNEKGLV